MSTRKGRHPRRRGPGGPRRATGGRTTSRSGSSRAPVPFARPPIDRVVAPLMDALRTVAPPGEPGRAIGVEMWADRMAESVYGPGAMPGEFYAELAEGLTSSADPDAPAALAALAGALPWREARALRKAHEERRRQVGDGDDSDLGIGRGVVTRAVELSHPQGDGVSLLFDVDQPTEAHCIGIYVDHNLGGIAKDGLTGPPLGDLADGRRVGDVPDLVLSDISFGEARARIEAALAATDHMLDPPIDVDLPTVRPLLDRRMAALPSGHLLPPRRPLGDDEVEALVAAFTSSPEAATLTPAQAQEAPWLIELWVDHATNEAIGEPHRVSPVLVELFCADWYPRTVVGEPAATDAAPAVLAAWVRYASRVTGLRDRWRDEALDAVRRWAPEMRRPPGAGSLVGDARDGRPHLQAVDDTSALDEDDGDDAATRDGHPSAWPAGPAWADPPPDAWKTLQSAIGAPPPWTVDDARVPPAVATKVKAICLHAVHRAADLLGPAFVQPAADLAVRLGELEPSPLPHTQDRVWGGAIVWLLAEDSGGFDPDRPGRRPEDMASDLGVGQPTLTRRVAQLRDRLDLDEGACRVPW